MVVAWVGLRQFVFSMKPTTSPTFVLSPLICQISWRTTPRFMFGPLPFCGVALLGWPCAYWVGVNTNLKKRFATIVYKHYTHTCTQHDQRMCTTFQHLFNNNKMYVYSFYIQFFHCCFKGSWKRKKMRLIYYYFWVLLSYLNNNNFIFWFESLIDVANVPDLIDIINVWFFVLVSN